MRCSGLITVWIVNPLLPRGRKLTTDTRPQLMNRTTHTDPNLARQGDTTRLLLIGPLHKETMMSQRLRQLTRNRPPRRLRTFSLVKRNAKMGTTRSTGSARIVVVVVPRKGGITPLIGVIHKMALRRSQPEAPNLVVNLCRNRELPKHPLIDQTIFPSPTSPQPIHHAQASHPRCSPQDPPRRHRPRLGRLCLRLECHRLLQLATRPRHRRQCHLHPARHQLFQRRHR